MATMAERFIPFPHPLMIGMDDLQRFWSKIDKESSPKGCWLWTAGTYHNNDSCGCEGSPYGQFWFHENYYAAHRVSWFFEHKTDPGEFLICHQCNTTLCVCPAHLYLGTSSMNVIQKALDGRCPKGERASKAVLSNDDAKLILESNETGSALARKFHVHRSTISAVRRGRTFKHLLTEIS